MLRLRPLSPHFPPLSPVYLIATWLQAGRIRPASGSWGTLAGLIFCWIIRSTTGFAGLFTFAFVVGIGGYYAVKAYLQKTDNPDPSEVVVDEVLGIAIVGLFSPFSIGYWLAGFALFRIFDSIKRGPVGWCDRNIKGAFGVMFDDVVAALISGFVVCGLAFIFH